MIAEHFYRREAVIHFGDVLAESVGLLQGVTNGQLEYESTPAPGGTTDYPGRARAFNFAAAGGLRYRVTVEEITADDDLADLEQPQAYYALCSAAEQLGIPTSLEAANVPPTVADLAAAVAVAEARA